MSHSLRLPSPTGHFYLSIDNDRVRDGNALAKENVEVSTLFISSWLALLSDSPITSSFRPRAVYTRFLNRLYRDMRGTVLSFANLAHKLSAEQYLMGTSTPSGEWIDEFKETPVFFEYHRFYQTGDPVLFSYLYTFLSFGKKMEYKDDEFKKAAFRGWLGVERRLSDLKVPLQHAKNLHVIMDTLLPKLSDYPFMPKHGPKNVAERIGRNVLRKHNCVTYDRLLDRAFFTGHTAKYGLAKEAGYGPEESLPDSSRWQRMKDSRPLPSEVRFVDKNLKVARSICMEPAKLMYFQQGVFHMMEDAVNDSPLRRFIRLRDQSFNRGLAEFGSYTGSIDTLDLSAASDSLSMKVVRSVFPTNWKIFMLATRNPVVRTPDGLVSIEKFAPMGSAVCFPAQCVFFTCLCIYAHILHHYEQHSSYDTEFVVRPFHVSNILPMILTNPGTYGKMKSRYQPLGVYGDDICCDYRVTAHVKSLLAHFGFEVNEDKSFTGSQAFRESCGGYYLHGVDVTPLYFRVKCVRRTIRYEHIYSQVHLINECFDKGFSTLRSFLIHSLREWKYPKNIGYFAIPFIYADNVDMFGIRSFKCDNSHLKSRDHTDFPNPDYQRTEYRCLSILSKVKRMIRYDHEQYLYMRWWASHHDGAIAVKNSSVHGLAGDTRLGWRWTPVD